MQARLRTYTASAGMVWLHGEYTATHGPALKLKQSRPARPRHTRARRPELACAFRRLTNLTAREQRVAAQSCYWMALAGH
eukprot:9838121-Alexandrium_andersonii.AAC.1